MLYNISKIKLDQTKRFELTQRIYKQTYFYKQSFSFFGTILIHERYTNKIKQTVEIPFYLLLYKLIESPVFHLLPAKPNFHSDHNDWQSVHQSERNDLIHLSALKLRMPVFTTAVTNCWITPNVPKLRPQIYTHNRSSRPRAGTPRRLRPRVKVFYDLPVRHARPLQVVRLNRCSAMLASFFFFFSQKRSRLWIMTVSIIKGRYDLRLNRKGSGLAHLVWQIIRRGDRATDFYKSFSETTQLGPLFSIT